jgi:outer membrane lipoprotein-sorting protein
MRRIRTASTRQLIAIAAALLVLVAGAGIAQAALSGAPTPAPKPLDRAVYDALQAPAVQGVSARIHFTNNLLPSGTLPDNSTTPLATGGDGRLWLTNDGKVRLELQSDRGDAQIVSDGKRFLIYDATSNTAYTGTLPAEEADATPAHPDQPATLDSVRKGLARLGATWTLSGAQPTSTAGRPSYTVRIAPKDDGGLLGAAEVAWDAVKGVPLRAAIYAQGASSPTLSLEATKIAFGPIPASRVDTTPPAGAKVVKLDLGDAATGGAGAGHDGGVEGADAVQKQLDFALAAPDTLAGLPRKSVRLIRSGDDNAALSTYGQGLGAIVVLEHKATSDGAAPSPDVRLPQVNIDGATGTELATALGTAVSFQRDGVAYLVIGSVAPVAAENAARGLG